MITINDGELTHALVIMHSLIMGASEEMQGKVYEIVKTSLNDGSIYLLGTPEYDTDFVYGEEELKGLALLTLDQAMGLRPYAIRIDDVMDVRNASPEQKGKTYLIDRVDSDGDYWLLDTPDDGTRCVFTDEVDEGSATAIYIKQSRRSAVVSGKPRMSAVVNNKSTAELLATFHRELVSEDGAYIHVVVTLDSGQREYLAFDTVADAARMVERIPKRGLVVPSKRGFEWFPPHSVAHVEATGDTDGDE